MRIKYLEGIASKAEANAHGLTRVDPTYHCLNMHKKMKIDTKKKAYYLATLVYARNRYSQEQSIKLIIPFFKQIDQFLSLSYYIFNCFYDNIL